MRDAGPAEHERSDGVGSAGVIVAREDGDVLDLPDREII